MGFQRHTGADIHKSQISTAIQRVKIVGLTHNHNQAQNQDGFVVAMKSDSSLLNQRKPFFMPDSLGVITVTECVAARICRLGKNIQPKFAARYIDSYALALDFLAEEKLSESKWAEGFAFDNSLCVGTWVDAGDFPPDLLPVKPSIEDAVAAISRIMTIRTGDIIFIDTSVAREIKPEQVYTLYINNEENLYCKIK